MNPTRARVLGVGIINQPARRRFGGLGQGHVGGANTCAARLQALSVTISLHLYYTTNIRNVFAVDRVLFRRCN